jgi:hypothetical protein
MRGWHLTKNADLIHWYQATCVCFSYACAAFTRNATIEGNLLKEDYLLDSFTQGKKMKKTILIGLSVCFVFGIMASCDKKDKEKEVKEAVEQLEKTGKKMAEAGSKMAEKSFHYHLKVRIDPFLNQLEAEAWIQQPPSPLFYLHKNLVIKRVDADGHGVAFRPDSSASPLPYTVGSPTVVEAQDISQLHITYCGEIKEIVNGVNMISPELVELAYYSAWYPIFQGMTDYTFEIETSVPTGFLTTTNGLLKKQWQEKDRTTSLWTSYQPAWDMVLLSSPQYAPAGRPIQRHPG